MLTEICGALRNWFTQDKDKHYGTFTVTDGTIAPLNFLQDGQYFRIIGSVFNDGVHQYPSAELTDEVFDGAVWAMRLPPAFLALAAEIKEYSQSDMAKPTPYTSESFGGYSYTRAADENGAAISWQTAFGKRLNQWRKL